MNTYIFSLYGLRPNTTVCKGDVFWYILRQMMAGHDHVDMFFDCINSVWLCRAGTAWENIWVLNERDHVRGVATASTLNMVGVNRTILERCGRTFNEA